MPSVKRPGRIAHLLVMSSLRMRMNGAVPPHFTCVFGVQLPIYFILMLSKVPYLLMFYTIVIKTWNNMKKARYIFKAVTVCVFVGI